MWLLNWRKCNLITLNDLTLPLEMSSACRGSVALGLFLIYWQTKLLAYSVWVQAHLERSTFLRFSHLQNSVESTSLPSKMLFTVTTKDKSVVLSLNIIAHLCFLVTTILWTSNPCDITFNVIENRELYTEKYELVLFLINVSCVQKISYHVFSATMISKEFGLESFSEIFSWSC